MARSGLLLWPVLWAVLLAGAPAHAQEPGTPPPAIDDESGPRSYRLELEGFSEIGLAERFRELSTLQAQRREPVAGQGQLNRRIRDDQEIAQRLLRSEGYFAAETGSRISVAAEGRLTVTLTVEPGPRYQFTDIELGGGERYRAELEKLGLKPGAPALTQVILTAEDLILTNLPRDGHPFPSLGQREVVVDHAVNGVSVSLAVSAGQHASFGQIEVRGETRLKTRNVLRFARFKAGRPYDQRLVDDLRDALLATGLFASVAVRPDPQGDPAQPPILVELSDAKLRTVAVSAGYGTGEGPKVEASWQHRNLFGGEERLTLRGRAGTVEQSALADLRKFNFRRRDQTLAGQLEAAREDTDAFRADTIGSLISLERETDRLWQKTWTYSVGFAAEVSRQRDALGLRNRFVSVSLPVSLRYDGTDDLFDPGSGWRAWIIAAPKQTLGTRNASYVRGEIGGSIYQPFGADGRTVLAARVRAGSILGSSLNGVPPSDRLYAGGGGSVRGFGYQRVGPLTAGRDPIGGRSLLEASLEGRYRLNERYGVAAFVDGGSISAGKSPRLDGFRFGAGLGFRYFADFGPIRVDLAAPVDRRRGESWFNVYVSVGQAF